MHTHAKTVFLGILSLVGLLALPPLAAAYTVFLCAQPRKPVLTEFTPGDTNMSRIFDKEVRLKQIIGRNLKAFRELAGFSQEDFAEKLGLSRATLSAIENGHSSIDSAKLVVAAHLLGRQVSEFFEETPEKLKLLYRAAADVTAPPEVRARFEQFCKAYRELEEIVGVVDNLLPPPEYSYSPDVQSKPLQFAAQVAASERDRAARSSEASPHSHAQLLPPVRSSAPWAGSPSRHRTQAHDLGGRVLVQWVALPHLLGSQGASKRRPMAGSEK